MYNSLSVFFFNDTATTEIYTLSLHDALPISADLDAALKDRAYPPGPHGGIWCPRGSALGEPAVCRPASDTAPRRLWGRSEEHTSELQSRLHLVCRLLLEKKNPLLIGMVTSIS